MAITSQREGTSRESQIDRLLHIAAVEWLTLPSKLGTFAEWDELEQMDFMLEWNLTEDRLRSLVAFAKGGEMNVDQFGLLRVILMHVEQYMPHVVALFERHEMDSDLLDPQEFRLSA